jgi:inorganic pyrophosphatase
MHVPPGPNPPKVIHAIVEIPKGRRSKFEVDKETGLLRLDRFLYSSAMYPGDYGFIPQTLAEDGDPLDVLVMLSEPTFSGCLIEARPLGIFKMTDKGENDFKVLAVPNTDPMYQEIRDLWRVPPHFLREVEHFFEHYKDLEGGHVKAMGWHQVDVAHREILKSVERYKLYKENGDMQAAIAAKIAEPEVDVEPTSDDSPAGDKPDDSDGTFAIRSA